MMQIGLGFKGLRVAIDFPEVRAAVIGKAISRLGARAAKQVRQSADDAAERLVAQIEGRKRRKK